MQTPRSRSSFAGPSIRIAAFAHGVSLWVDGSERLRDWLGSDLPQNEQLNQVIGTDADAVMDERLQHLRRTSPFLNWLICKPADVSRGDGAALGIAQIVTSLAIFRKVGLRPLLPFLVAPFLSNITLPSSVRDRNRLKWVYMIPSSIALAFLHELHKVLILHLIKWWRRWKRRALEATVGDVRVRGKVSTNGFPVEEEQEECLICSGVGIDEPLSEYDSAPSPAPGTASEPQLQSSEPLEGFCTAAPNKHLVHGACFLRWMEEYQRQRGTLAPTVLQVAPGSGRAPRGDPRAPTLHAGHILQRARLILERAGLGCMTTHMHFPTPTHLEGNEGDPLSILTLFMSATSSTGRPLDDLSNPEPRHLATLRTSSPPCPGCRSPVELLFRSQPPPTTKRQTGNEGHKTRVRVLLQGLIRDWQRHVTGRTLALKLLSQFSLLYALLNLLQRQKVIPRLL